MASAIWTSLGIAGAAIVLLATGWWRLAFARFGIPADAMTVRKLGLAVTDPRRVERVDGILRSFAGGFNAMISRPSTSAWRAYCASLPSLFDPFAHEGAAMGFVLRRLFRFDAAAFEEALPRTRPEFRYLYYVGLGFWAGMRNYGPQRLERLVRDLDPMYRFLVYDGYGFQTAFFGPTRTPADLSRLESLAGYARNAAYQGVGRAVFFLFMDDHERLVGYVRPLGRHETDAAAGIGLAAVFVQPDRLDAARDLASSLPRSWQEHVHLGMCFGLKARSINDADYFEQCVAPLDEPVRQAVWTSIRECDRVELQVRAEHASDGYSVWRERVAQWMSEHVAYPLAGAEGSTKISAHRATARAEARGSGAAVSRNLGWGTGAEHDRPGSGQE